MRENRLVRLPLALCTLALTLAACGAQAPVTKTADARQDGPPPGASVQEFAATPILPIATLPETLERQPALREFLKKEGKLDPLLAQAARAKNTLTASATTGGTCLPVRWLLEQPGKLTTGDSFKCSVPFQTGSLYPSIDDLNGNYVTGNGPTTGDGKRTSLSREVNLPSRPGALYEVGWFEFVQFPDGSYWAGPDAPGDFYTTARPGVAPRTPVTVSGQGYQQAEASGTRAYASLNWTFPPPTTFLARGHRIYDVTTDKRTLVAEKPDIVLYWFHQPVTDHTVAAGAYTPGMKRKYQVCTYNALEELCGKALQVKWAGGQAPTASFASSPAAPLYVNPVNFDASASRDPDGRVVSYHWDFGDFTTADAQSAAASHSYDSPGEYEVRLTVTDNDGNKGEYRRTVLVIDPAPALTAELVTTNGTPTRAVNLTWTPAQGMSVTEYRVKRQTPDHSDEPPVAVLPPSASTYQDTLPADATIWADYQVCAFNAGTGEEVCSEAASLTLPY